MRSLVISALLTLGFAGSALAADELNVTKGGTLAGKPLALHGYDPVAYFTVGKPTPGSGDISAVHDGATYYFSSEANKKTFEASPEKYVPQYGGFCAFGVALGKKFDGNPEVFLVREGKLYLNLSPGIGEKFNSDVPGNIAKAEKNWPGIRSKAVGAL